jgi:UDP-glucose 4-epimerase
MEDSVSKTILVTGGAGFIGSHLIEELLKDGRNKLISLDNYFTGSEKNHVPGATYLRGETKDIETLVTEKPDIIYHLGEYSRVLTSFDDIPMVWRLNDSGTFSVLEYCRKNKVRLIYAGSSTKFGEFDDKEDGQNQTPYAFFKAKNTELVNNYGNWYGLDYAITYFYNVYGGREMTDGKYATLIGIFSRKHMKKEPLTVVSPGSQLRAFTHVTDTVRGLMLVGEKGQGDGYCIGSGTSHSILEVAKYFGGEITMLPAMKGDRKYSNIDPTRIKGLGWSESVDLKDHIAKFKESLLQASDSGALVREMSTEAT